jgi:hypothetical protein
VVLSTSFVATVKLSSRRAEGSPAARAGIGDSAVSPSTTGTSSTAVSLRTLGT